MEITLGIDIGTQFCYAGFFDENKKFQSLVDEQDINYGIPATVTAMYISEENGSNKWDYRCLYEAEQVLAGNLDSSRVESLEPADSLKSLLRKNWDNLNTTEFPIPSLSTCKNKSIKEVAQTFMNRLARDILDKLNEQQFNKNKINYIIRKIAIGYPDPNPDPNPGTRANTTNEEKTSGYVSVIKGIVETAFINEIKKSKRRYVQLYRPLSVYAKAESIIAAEIMRVIGHDQADCIVTVDIGAGTTDFSVLAKANNKYEAKFSESCDFGGKCVDYFLSQQYNDIKRRSHQVFIDAKEYIFNNVSIDKLASKFSLKYIFTVKPNCNQEVCDFRESPLYNYNRFIEKLKATLYYVNDVMGTECTVGIILMGGSSKLSFINQDVKDIVEEQSYRDCKILSIDDVGKDYGITNSNFISFGAALLEVNGEKLIQPERILKLGKNSYDEIEPSRESIEQTHYTSFSYAVNTFINGNINRFQIIVKRGFDAGISQSPLIEYDSYINQNNIRTDINLDYDTIYQISGLDENVKVGEFIYPEECNYKSLGRDDFDGLHGQIMGTRNKCFKLQAQFDPNREVGKQLKIIVYVINRFTGKDIEIVSEDDFVWRHIFLKRRF